MSRLTIPSDYRMPLSNNELQQAIELIHNDFQHNLTIRLNLHRVSAPLFVDGRTRWSIPWPSGNVWPSSATTSPPVWAFTPI